MSTLEEVKEATAKLLGVRIEDVSYITEELLAEYRKESNPIQVTGLDADGKSFAPAEATLVPRWGQYGNTITYDPGSTGLAYWKSDAVGQPNYGCGSSLNWHAGKADYARYITQKGTCAGGVRWFLIANYDS